MHDATGTRRPTGPEDGWVEVDLPFPGVRQFEEEFAPNLATDGLFIPTPEPLPPSTVVRFHVTLPDDFVLLEGTGVVVWSREPGDPSGAPPGMSLRFATLSPHYQDLLDRIVQTHVERGGTPFEVEPQLQDELGSPAARGVAWERPRLMVRRAGGPVEVSARGDTAPATAGPIEAPGFALDQTVSLSPRDDAAARSDPPEWSGIAAGSPAEGDETSVGGGSAPRADVGAASVETHWPPWEDEHPPQRTEAALDDGDAEARALGSVATDGAANAEADSLGEDVTEAFDVEVDRPVGISDDASTHDVDEEFGFGEWGTSAPPTPPDPESDHVSGAPRTRRRWSMGRTIGTLAAAVAVVSVVAVLTLSPWSRLIGSDEGAPEAGARSGGDGIVTAIDETSGPPPRDAGGVEQSSEASLETVTAESIDAAVETVDEEPADVSAAAASESPQAGRPAARIESIQWTGTGTETRVTLRGDGDLLPDRVAVIPMESPARILIRIRRIEERYQSYVMDVGLPHVTAIRTGLHPELKPPALYVVLDLPSDDVRVVDTAFDGPLLTVTLAG